MKETFLLWKNIFTKPAEAYKQITPQTKIGFCLLLLLLVLTVSGLLLLPILTSAAYHDAYLRANLNFMEKSGLLTSPGVRKTATDNLNSPLTRGFLAIGPVIGPALSLLVVLFVASLVLWLVGLVTKNKVPFKAGLRVFAFTWAVYAWQALIQSVILLISDHQALLGKVHTMTDFSLALTVPFSLAALFPPGSVGLAAIVAIDFVTNIFNIIFYYLLYTGLRAQSVDQKTWKTGIAVGVLALFHFSLGFFPALLF
jgi:hypothetical protein